MFFVRRGYEKRLTVKIEPPNARCSRCAELY